MTKSAVFGVMHVMIAFSVAYVLTGSMTISGLITIVEPICNTVAHYFFDKYWDDPRLQAWRERVAKRSGAHGVASRRLKNERISSRAANVGSPA